MVMFHEKGKLPNQLKILLIIFDEKGKFPHQFSETIIDHVSRKEILPNN